MPNSPTEKPSPPPGFTLIELTREPIELYKILKFENLVGSGGEAKMAVAEGLVQVNGEIETQKRKKVKSGDTIEFADERLFLRLSESAVEPASQPRFNSPPKDDASRKPVIALSKGKR